MSCLESNCLYPFGGHHVPDPPAVSPFVAAYCSWEEWRCKVAFELDRITGLQEPKPRLN